MLRRACPLLVCLLIASCGGSSGAPKAAGGAQWRHFKTLKLVVDLAGPRHDGRFVANADYRLFLVGTSGAPVPFARGAHGYSGKHVSEAYIAMSGQRRLGGAGCSFHSDDVYILQSGKSPAIVRVTAGGRASTLAKFPQGGAPGAIAFDGVGSFGHRVLATAQVGKHFELYAFDCRGHVRTISKKAPRVEGGIAVAPMTFGSFGGELIAPDEHSGQIWAIGADGKSRKLADSGIPKGGDIGVESAGFAPGKLGRRIAYLADRASPGSPTKGTNSILRLKGGALLKAGVGAGDLIVVAEANARTIAVHCAASCSVREVATGPAAAHAEGHIVFSAPR